MNRNRHLRYKPIIETRPFLGGIGVLARCPKCKTIIQMQQSKCKCGSIFEFEKSECNVTDQMGVMHDGLGSYNIKCPVCRNRQYFNW